MPPPFNTHVLQPHQALHAYDLSKQLEKAIHTCEHQHAPERLRKVRVRLHLSTSASASQLSSVTTFSERSALVRILLRLRDTASAVQPSSQMEFSSSFSRASSSNLQSSGHTGFPLPT
uniref:Uncharacterized protein n=1 Tax=Chrysotila carterae TaxID=13221 RepID=A0A7S4BN77_CHRCT